MVDMVRRTYHKVRGTSEGDEKQEGKGTARKGKKRGGAVTIAGGLATKGAG